MVISIFLLCSSLIFISGSGPIPHFNWSIYRGGNFFLLVKLDEKLIENGLEGQKFLVVCIFWGGCHRPNVTKEDNGFLNLNSYH